MPIREFLCPECGEVSEEFRRRDGSYNRDVARCSVCGAIAKRVVSRVNFNFTPWADNLKREVDYALTPEE